MFQLADGRQHIYQWDINVKLLLDESNESADEVHFSARFSRVSLSVEVVHTEDSSYVIIPNILLQKPNDIIAYSYITNADGSYTKYDTIIPVIARPKPSGYIYEETEILTWKTLDDKIDDLGKSTADAVKYTEQELTDEQKAQARTNIGAISSSDLVQADWNQSNKKQLDYVKNRTHYTHIVHDSGYMADLMDSTHNFGDIILLRNIPISILDMLFIPGINASYRSEYAFHIVYKVTFHEGTDVYEYEVSKECIANEEMEISEFSTGNIKVLCNRNKREPSIALYIIYDLTTLNDEDKTKFSKTGIYAQLVSLNAADTASSILVGYRSIKYKKLHSKYIDIPVATNDVAGVVKPASKTDDMTQPVGVDENGELFAKQVQTDWDQKDNTATDYLKNKPFYLEKTLVVELTKDDFTVNDQDGYLKYMYRSTPKLDWFTSAESIAIEIEIVDTNGKRYTATQDSIDVYIEKDHTDDDYEFWCCYSSLFEIVSGVDLDFYYDGDYYYKDEWGVLVQYEGIEFSEINIKIYRVDVKKIPEICLDAAIGKTAITIGSVLEDSEAEMSPSVIVPDLRIPISPDLQGEYIYYDRDYRHLRISGHLFPYNGTIKYTFQQEMPTTAGSSISFDISSEGDTLWDTIGRYSRWRQGAYLTFRLRSYYSGGGLIEFLSCGNYSSSFSSAVASSNLGHLYTLLFEYTNSYKTLNVTVKCVI